MSLELVTLATKPGSPMESQSGLQQKWPRVYGALARAETRDVAAIVIHPTSNFMGHYLMPYLPKAGVTLFGLNTRYVGNDSVLIFERVIQDLGVGVKYLRAEGYKKVILLGNSGGASTVSFYQAEAEELTIRDTPAGDPIDVTPADLPPVDGIALFGAHPGRSHIISHWLDASVIAEDDPQSADPELDIYDPANGPPFKPAFLEKVRAAQKARHERITASAQARLRYLRSRPDGPRDEAFVVYRTLADPRIIDLALDRNDRPPESIWGHPKTINYGANNIGRFTTLTSWLSQWSPLSRADGPKCIARSAVPVLNLEYSADAAVFPSEIKLWSDAIGKGREEYHKIPGARHYLDDQPKLLAMVVELIASWARRL
jgi:hypothetical protein